LKRDTSPSGEQFKEAMKKVAKEYFEIFLIYLWEHIRRIGKGSAKEKRILLE